MLNSIFSPDGKWLATTSRYEPVRLWLAQLDDLLMLTCEYAGRNLTLEEWQTYFPDEPYRVTCPQWPPHFTVSGDD